MVESEHNSLRIYRSSVSIFYFFSPLLLQVFSHFGVSSFETVVDRRVRLTTHGLESPQPVLDPVDPLPPGSGLMLICGRTPLHSTPTDQ